MTGWLNTSTMSIMDVHRSSMIGIKALLIKKTEIKPFVRKICLPSCRRQFNVGRAEIVQLELFEGLRLGLTGNRFVGLQTVEDVVLGLLIARYTFAYERIAEWMNGTEAHLRNRIVGCSA